MTTNTIKTFSLITAPLESGYLFVYLFAICAFDYLSFTPSSKLSLFGLLSLPVTFYLMLTIALDLKGYFKVTFFHSLMFFMVFWFFLATMFAVDFDNSFQESVYFLRLVVFVVLVIACFTRMWKEEFSGKMASCFVIIFAIFCLSVITDIYGITNFSGLTNEQVKFRSQGFLRGGLYGTLIPIVFYPFLYYKVYQSIIKGRFFSLFFFLAIAVIGFVATFLLSSWSATLAYVMVTVTSISFILFKYKNKFKIFGLFALIILAIIVWPFLKSHIDRYEDIDRVFSKYSGLFSFKIDRHGIRDQQGSTEERLIYFNIALKHFWENPVFGLGPKGILYTDNVKTHNNFMQMFAETGLIGGCSFILLILTVFHYLVKGLRNLGDQMFWFCMLNSFLVCLIIMAVECYFQFKLFWVFVVPLSVFANDSARQCGRSMSDKHFDIILKEYSK